MSSTVRVMSAEEIAARAGGGEIRFLRLPERELVFAEREMRLRQLAFGHGMHDFLLFVAALANAQQRCLQSFPDVTLPSLESLEKAARALLPPLPAPDVARDPVWCDTARTLARDLLAHAPAPLHDTLKRLAGADDVWLDAQADRLLTNVMEGLDLASAAVVAAALQVYFAHLVQATGRRYDGQVAGGYSLPFGRTADPGLCPCCGSRPTAAITRLQAGVQGQRYLACSLCSTQWHMVRIQCSHCLATEGIAYESLLPRGDGNDARDDQNEGSRAAQAAIQAEVCDQCGHYLKLMHMDRDPNVDPCADDLATIPLDLLVSQAGRQRHGVNLLLLYGDPAGGAEPGPDPGTG